LPHGTWLLRHSVREHLMYVLLIDEYEEEADVEPMRHETDDGDTTLPVDPFLKDPKRVAWREAAMEGFRRGN
jgi:hypothetical protein